jgi:hypothetical protein
MLGAGRMQVKAEKAGVGLVDGYEENWHDRIWSLSAVR